MARWHTRKEPDEALSGWAKKSRKLKAATLEGIASLYSCDTIPTTDPTTDPTPTIKPGTEPKGIKTSGRPRTKPLPDPNVPKRPMGRPLGWRKPIDPNKPAKIPKVKKVKDPFHERYEQHVVVTYSRKRGLPFYAVPNAARRTLWEAIEAKKSGIAPGVPDLCYPCALGEFSGLYIEMKRRVGGVVSPMQKYWFALLRENGYRVEVAEGADQAILILEEYFKDYKGISNATLTLLQIAFDTKRRAADRKRLLPMRGVRESMPSDKQKGEEEKE